MGSCYIGHRMCLDSTNMKPPASCNGCKVLIPKGTCQVIMEGAKVRITKDVNTENALVVACFPSIGMVSSVVAHFLIDHLGLEFVGAVVDSRLPVITLVNDGEPMPVRKPMFWIVRGVAHEARALYIEALERVLKTIA